MKTSMKAILVAAAGILLCASWCLVPPIAQGARVTGQDNVVSTTDEQGSGAARPAAPMSEAVRPVTPPPAVPEETQEPPRMEAPPAENAAQPEEASPPEEPVQAAGEEEAPPVREEAIAPPEEPATSGPDAGAPGPGVRQPRERRPSVRSHAGTAAAEPGTPAGSAAATGSKKIEMPPKGAKYVTIDFDEVDIRVFIKFMSELTGKNFIVDRNVKGTVTVMSPRKISIDEAYKVFESVLEVHDFAAVPTGDVIKILPFRSAKEKSIETRLREEAQDPEDRVVTQIIPLKFADPEEMKKILTPLMSKSSIALSYTPTGMLIITDLLSNIERLMVIIQALDVEGVEEQIAVLPLQYANAGEVAKSLTQIFQKGTGQKKDTIQGGVKIVPDDRTNSLVILASENTTARIRELIALLDKEVPRGEAKIRVYRLKNAQAEELAKVLAGIPTSKDAKGGQAPKEEVPVLSKDVKVVPDKATNTLIITASRDDYNVLEEVIRELDIPRPMVFIEALIMEVNVNKGFDLGVNWQGGDDFTYYDREAVYGGGFTGGNILPSINSTTGAVTLPTGLAVGVVGEAIEIGGVKFPSLSAVLQAYKKDEDVNILSTPQIMTLDNNEAEIQVGENVPYLTRQETSTTDHDYSTYEYKDVGVTLRLTPQISQERFVKLAIFQEVTKLVSQGDVRPTTLKRSTKTAVTIKDANTVVIGGLIGDDISNTEIKIPLLGDIPLLGYLFKYKTEVLNRRNLFIFITPHIVESPVEAEAIFDEKREHMDTLDEGVIRRYQWNRGDGDEGQAPEE